MQLGQPNKLGINMKVWLFESDTQFYFLYQIEDYDLYMQELNDNGEMVAVAFRKGFYEYNKTNYNWEYLGEL